MLGWTVAHTWDGRPIPDDEIARLSLGGTDPLILEVDAPLHGDPPPPGPPGPTAGLWEYEVVELFLVGDDTRYLEIELGPHGHHLALRLDGVRNVVARELPLELEVTRARGRWRGRAVFPREWVPSGALTANAYAIHGTGAARRYLAAHAVPGPHPDFHRLDCFRSIALAPNVRPGGPQRA